MKYLIILVLISGWHLTATAQKANWKEMHDFHAIMSSTFHPTEEGNLQPLKDSSAALLKAAKSWQKSTVPEGYNASSVQPVLTRLTDECAAINNAVKAKKPDADLTKMITKAHDTFHEIMEKCKE